MRERSTLMGKHTLAFAFAVSFAPNVSRNAFSTAFLRSNGLAHRSSGVFFRPVMVDPRLVQPATALALMYSVTRRASSSAVMLNPIRRTKGMRVCSHCPGVYDHTYATLNIEVLVVYGSCVALNVLHRGCKAKKSETCLRQYI